jgi:hypothetical protein
MGLASGWMRLFLAGVCCLGVDQMSVGQDSPPAIRPFGPIQDIRPFGALEEIRNLGAAPQEVDLAAKFGVSQLVELESERQGQVRYGMFVNVPKGQGAVVTLQETPPRRGYARGHFPISKEAGGEVKLELEFEYGLDDKQDVANPLLSSIDTIGYGYQAIGSDDPRGAVSAFSLPLNKLKAADKKIVLLDPNSPLAKTENGYRLMLIIPKDANPKTPAEIEAIQPRGEVVMTGYTVTEDPGPPIEDQLRRAWYRRNSAIGTAYFKYSPTFLSGEYVKELTIAEVDKILGDKPWRLSRKEAAAKLEQLYTEKTAAFEKAAAAAEPAKAFSELRCVGLRTIERASYGHVRLIEGDLDIWFDPDNGQVTVSQGDEDVVMHSASVQDFLGTRIGIEILDGAKTELVDGLVVVDSKGVKVIADPKTGLLLSTLTHLENGEPYDYTLNFEPQTLRGGVVLPRLTVTMRFQDGKLDSVEEYSVEEMRINEPFSEDDFKLSLAAGTTVTDQRNAGPRGRDAYRLRKPVEDAAAYFRQRLPKQPARKARQ